jgi:DNA-binding response OmpR family regulator
MKVLIVEDQEELSSNIKSYLENEGYICEVAPTLSRASEKLYGYSYDVILLDLMLPDGDGMSLLHTIKSNWVETGVLIVSAKNAIDDKVKGLNLGADDYLSKPFHLTELNARLKAIYRRKRQKGENSIQYNDVHMNMDTFEVSVKNNSLELTRKEFEILQFFIVNKNRLLTKQAIAEHLWGDYMDSVDSFDFVYQHIKNLRRKMESAGGEDIIHTIYGTGYKLKG